MLVTWVALSVLLVSIQSAVIKITGPDQGMAIQQAIDSAQPGDTIQISRGVYSGDGNCNLQVITHSDISLVGTGETIIDCNGLSRCLTVVASRITISGIDFRNGLSIKNVTAAAAAATTTIRNVRLLPVPRRLLVDRKPTIVGMITIPLVLTADGKLREDWKQRKLALSASADAAPFKRRKQRVIREKASIRTSSASDSVGGCVFVADSSMAVLSNIRVSGGMAALGGGMAVVNSSLVINSAEFFQNGIGSYSGGGLYLESCNSVSMNGPLVFKDNVIFGTVMSGNARGGGLFIAYCNNVIVTGPLTSSGNSIIATHPNVGEVGGAAISLLSCASVSFSADLSIVNNSVSGSGQKMATAWEIDFCSYVNITGPAVFSQNVMASKSGVVYSGAVRFQFCSNCVLQGPMVFTNNIVLNVKTTSSGTAVTVFLSANFKIIGPLEISRNLALLDRTTAMDGVGMSIDNCASLLLVGPVTIFNNVLNVTNTPFSVTVDISGVGLSINACPNSRIIGPISVRDNVGYFSGQTITIYGGGAMFSGVRDSIITGSISLVGNAMYSDGISFQGGGLYLESCNNLTFSASLSLSKNRIQSNYGSVAGAGLYAYKCQLLVFSGPISVSGNIGYSMGSYSIGGGLAFSSCQNLTISGTTSITNNSAISYAASAVASGGGLFLDSSDSTHIVMTPGSILTISQNAAKSMSYGTAFGGGICVSNSDNSVISGDNISISNNSAVSRGYGAHGGGLYIGDSLNFVIRNSNFFGNSAQGLTSAMPYQYYNPPARTANVTHCAGIVTITSESGNINDGSLSRLSTNIRCGWLISPTYSSRAMGYLNFTFSRFFLYNGGGDLLSIYSGGSSYSPLLGQYTGVAPNTACTGGPCPTLTEDNFVVGGQLFLLLATGQYPVGSGFSMDWSTIPSNRSSGSSTSMLTDPSLYPAYAFGAGMTASRSTVTSENLYFEKNQVSSMFFAVGAGMMAVWTSSVVRNRNLTMRGNQAVGLHVGGAMSSFLAASNTCSDCVFEANSVLAAGTNCFLDSNSNSVLCRAAFGAAVVAASGSSVSMTRVNITGNQASCLTQSGGVQCGVYGGSVSAVHAATKVFVANIRCTNSVVTCTGKCGWGTGGCLYGDSITAWINGSFFSNNAVSGIGSGGALSISGSSAIYIYSTSITNNTAREGGGIGQAGNSMMTVYNSTLSNNVAAYLAGAWVLRDSASTAITLTRIENNIAARITSILSFNDDSTAKYKFDRVTLLTSPGSVAIMLGLINMTSYSVGNRIYRNVWNCTQPGTIFTQDLTSEFFSLACVACGPGTYAADAASTLTIGRTCVPCPFGSLCNGSTPNSNGLLALSGYWGVVNESSGEASFFSCPIGYCCPLSQVACTYNYCNGGRTGRLCGACSPGYGFRFFTEACGSDDDCDDGVWVAWLVAIGSVIAVISLLETTGRQSTGLLSVLLYFYQVLPLVKSTPWRYSSSIIIIVTQSIFNFSPSSGESDSHGVCIYKSMTASQRLGARMLLQAVIFSTLVVVFCFHFVASRSNVHKFFRRHPAKISHYFATAVRFTTIAYTTLVLVPLQMVQCKQVMGKNVWYWDAAIECYEGWQKAGFFAIAILIPLPMGLLLLLKYHWKKSEDLQSDWQKETFQVLSNAFKPTRQWWLGVSLYRRFLLVAASTMISDSNWKSMATTVLCMCFIALNFAMKPFRTRVTQKCETMSLLILGALAATSASQLSQIQFGTSEKIFGEASLEWLQFFLSIGPALAYLIVMCYRLLKWAKAIRMMILNRRNTPSGSLESATDMEIWETESSVVGIEDCLECQKGQLGVGCAVHNFC